MSQKIISQLISIKGLEIECPNPDCNEQFPVKNGKLFSMYDSYPPAIQKIIRERFAEANNLKDEVKERRKKLANDKKRKPEKITTSTKATNFGQISEQIIPAFLTFPYKQQECRILFKPIDYIVFRNLAKGGHVEAIKFVDVKTGKAPLEKKQKQIRDRIVSGKVEHSLIAS